MTDRAAARRQLKDLATRLLDVAEGEVVMVTELACLEPGCPPVETVLAVLGTRPARQLKIHKAIPDVTEADVIAALASNHRH